MKRKLEVSTVRFLKQKKENIPPKTAKQSKQTTRNSRGAPGCLSLLSV